MLTNRRFWFPPIIWLLIAGCATSGSVGARSGAVNVSSGAQDPVMNSTMMGAAIGSLGGPIGLGVGAVLGFVRGLHLQSKLEEQAKQEQDRQAQIDKELAQEIEAKRQETARGGMAGSTGLILLTDHLAPDKETVPSADPRAAGEGLILLGDNTGPSKAKGSTTTHAAAVQPEHSSPPASEPEVHTSEGEDKEAADARKALEKEIAAARERTRKLHAAIQGSPFPAKPPRRPSMPAKKSRPTMDSKGFRLIYEGDRLVRKERDVNGDNRPDIVRYYDETGRLTRQEEDSRLDGRVDTWTFHEDGRPVRKESDTNGDGKVDLWAFYDEKGKLVRTEVDSDGDNHRDHVILYSQGEMVKERRYTPGLESPRFVATYAQGVQTRKEEDTDGDGRINRVTEYDDSGHVTKISRDTAGQGAFNLFAYYEPQTGKVLREEEDLNGDRTIDVISYFQKGRLVRREFFDLPADSSVKLHVPLASVPEEQKP